MRRKWSLTRDYFFSHLSIKWGGKIRPNCSGCCINLKNLSVKLFDKEILKEISFHLHCGSLNILIGPNGAGKSTLLKTLLGEYKFSGEISFSSSTKKKERPPRIGYVPQTITLDESSLLTVEDLFNVSNPPFSPTLRDHALKMLKEVSCESFYKRRLASLSGGERQRVFLALALTPLPNLLLLDEPLSGVDKKMSDQFFELLKKLRSRFDLSILMVSHDLLRTEKYADRVLFLDKKLIADGTPAAVFAHENVREKIQTIKGDELND